MIAVMCFGFLTNLFTVLTVHVYVMFTHLNSDRKWLVEMTISFSQYIYIRESVDSLCRDGADTQYMQYLSKSLFKRPGFLFECLSDQQDSYKWPKATRKTVKQKSVR